MMRSFLGSEASQSGKTSTTKGCHSECNCLTELELEDYIFDRTTGADLDRVEEHLLVCADCQDRLQEEEEYVAVFRTAARDLRAEELAASRVQRPTPESWAERISAFWSSLNGMAKPSAAAACMVVALAVWLPFRGNGDLATVSLKAERGGTLMAIATATANQRINLRVDMTGLEGQPSYRLEIVDVLGKHVAERRIQLPPSEAVWQLDDKLAAGTYWVRAYGGDEGLLREFQLNVE